MSVKVETHTSGAVARRHLRAFGYTKALGAGNYTKPGSPLNAHGFPLDVANARRVGRDWLTSMPEPAQ